MIIIYGIDYTTLIIIPLRLKSETAAASQPLMNSILLHVFGVTLVISEQLFAHMFPSCEISIFPLTLLDYPMDNRTELFFWNLKIFFVTGFVTNWCYYFLIR